MSKINSAGKLYDMPDDPRIAQLQAENERLADDNRRLTECWDTEMMVHKETSAENERLGIDMRAWKIRAETAEAENARLRALIEAYLENDSQANWDALAAAIS